MEFLQFLMICSSTIYFFLVFVHFTWLMNHRQSLFPSARRRDLCLRYILVYLPHHCIFSLFFLKFFSFSVFLEIPSHHTKKKKWKFYLVALSLHNYTFLFFHTFTYIFPFPFSFFPIWLFITGKIMKLLSIWSTNHSFTKANTAWFFSHGKI